MAHHDAPIGDFVVYSEATDPNELMGRPGGYDSKINFADTRLETEFPGEFDSRDGGSIEVYSSESGAVTRSEYLQAILQSSGLFGSEYHVMAEGVLVRVSGRLTPDQANIYQGALERTLEDLAAGIEHDHPALGETTSTTEVPATPPEAQPAIDGTVIVGNSEPPWVRGTPGEVSVIKTGAMVKRFSSGDGVVYVVVRNNTPQPVVGVEVSALLRDDAGTLVGSGDSLEVVPNLVRPGHVAWADVYIEGYEPEPGEVEGEYTITWQQPEAQFAPKPSHLDILEWAEQPSTVVVVGTNPWDEDVSFPQANLLCLDEAGVPFADDQDYASPDPLAPADSAAATVELPDDCNMWILTMDSNRF